MDARAAEVLESLVQRPSELAYIAIANLKDDLLKAIEGDDVQAVNGRIITANASLMCQQQDSDTLTACLQYMQEAILRLSPEVIATCLRLTLGAIVACVIQSEIAAFAEDL